MTDTLALFPEMGPALTESEPMGLRYTEAVVSPEVQGDLIDRARTLGFAPFDFRGFKGNRRTVSFGSRYDFTHSRVEPADPMPDWLKPLRAAAAVFADILETELVQALVTEYAPARASAGTGIAPSTARSLACRSSPTACSVSGAPISAGGDARPKPCAPAPPICSTVPPVTPGSTASRPAISSATR